MKYIQSVLSRHPFVNIHNVTQIQIAQTKDDLFIRFDDIVWRGYKDFEEFSKDKEKVIEAMAW